MEFKLVRASRSKGLGDLLKAQNATIIDFTARDTVTDPLTDLLRKGAREFLQAAVEAERDAFLAAFAERRTVDGRADVVGSGYHPERAFQTGIGPVTVKVPKVRAKDGKPVTFRSALVPPYIYSGLRGTDDRLCVLVVLGVNALGEKHFWPSKTAFGKAPKAGERVFSASRRVA